MVDDAANAGFRQEVRRKTLAAATAQMATNGWDNVRISDLATAVGVSRPTIYSEFGNKDGIAEALVLEEVRRFLAGVTRIFQENIDDPILGIEHSVRYTLHEAERSVMLRAVLTSVTPQGERDTSLLPFITTRGAPMLNESNRVLLAWFTEHTQHTSQEQLRDAVDSLVRLLVSHIMEPSDRYGRTPAKFGRLAALLIPELKRQ